MSLLFKGRPQGASDTRVGLWQMLSMLVISHIRQALNSLGELWRQPAASLMTIGVLGLSITLPSTLYILVKNTEKITAGWEQASAQEQSAEQESAEGHVDEHGRKGIFLRSRSRRMRRSWCSSSSSESEAQQQ